MPCWLRTSIALDLGKVQPEVLRQALQNLGLTVEDFTSTPIRFYGVLEGVRVAGDIAQGQLRMESRATNLKPQANAIRRKITETAITLAATRFGFTLTQENERTLTLEKRRFG